MHASWSIIPTNFLALTLKLLFKLIGPHHIFSHSIMEIGFWSYSGCHYISFCFNIIDIVSITYYNFKNGVCIELEKFMKEEK